MTITYNTLSARKVCADNGLAWDEETAETAAGHMAAAEFTQHQYDIAMRLHVDALRKAFDPKRYGCWSRLAIVLHFLGIRSLF